MFQVLGSELKLYLAFIKNFIFIACVIAKKKLTHHKIIKSLQAFFQKKTSNLIPETCNIPLTTLNLEPETLNLKRRSWYLLIFVTCLLSCTNTTEKTNSYPVKDKIFTRLHSNETGIDFRNDLEESENFDVFRYRNYYNGAGVSIGDINNDGLPDIYLTSNLKQNKLFLNQGNLHFKDITDSASVGGTKAWSTGVSMVDINADGFLDIYVCNSGDIKGDDKENELFINNGNLTFTESAKAYGLANEGFSTHAVFFDYDKDGDLDCYLLNNSFLPISTLGYRNIRDERDELGGDKLLRNDKGKYTDVSAQAGIYGSVIGFGLGVTVGDINNDNWPDIYVSNDFFERDYLYINNGNGTFSERLESSLGHISMFSMGADMADLNNDGYLDIFSTDMLPADNHRLKTITAFESYDVYQLKVKNGYYHQYMRNMLQLNNQNGTFSEIGQVAGVSATDWSWGALMADFNNDGYKEIFVSNGIYRDVTDQDFLEYVANEENVKAALEGRKIDYQKVIKKMPSNKLSNYIFTIDGKFHYKNVSHEWGLDEPSFSNGAAYGDLDNDGDLDLVINNVNQEIFVYRNETEKRQAGNHSISINFKGSDKNTFGLGCKVDIFKGAEVITHENMPIRGYQSSMDYKMVIGLGAILKIDSMRVTWPDHKVQMLTNVPITQVLTLEQRNATVYTPPKEISSDQLFKQVHLNNVFRHIENDFNDFNNQRFISQMLSTEGPALAVADINNDKLDDFFVGGASGQSGAIYIQNSNGDFAKLKTECFEIDSVSEDTDAIFFDADNDGDQDLYVVSGGSEFAPASKALQDRLYINNGLINSLPSFSKSNSLPEIFQNGSCVRVFDYDKDGDQDIFLGTRVTAGQYGMPCDQYLLENNGKGAFIDISKRSPGFQDLGMVTDAQWFDYNSDGWMDLIVVGEWMPITILKNNHAQTFTKTEVPSLKNTEGWWNTIEPGDVDNDGDIDFIIGNLGLNSKFKTSYQNPVSLYVKDFDNNNSLEQVYTYQKDGVDYPVALKQELSRQLTFLNKKFQYNNDFADKSIGEVFDHEMLKDALVLRAYEFNSCFLINNSNENFQFKPLPVAAQFGQVMDAEILDVDGDGNMDVILGGNMFSAKTDVGRYDALYSTVLKGNGKDDFKTMSSNKSGLHVSGEIRGIEHLKGKENDYIVIARSNDVIRIFKIN